MFDKTRTLEAFDPDIWQSIQNEGRRQEEHIELIASENFTLPAVMQAQGTILTNNHVVAGATAITAVLADGREVPADLVGAFPSNDVALIQTQGVDDLTVAELGESSEMEVGDDVVAVGNALALGAKPTVTTGIVSAVARSIRAEDGQTLDQLIQTDAAINPGNSGGVLADSTGRMVGVSTAVAGVGLGLAVPINGTTRAIIDTLMAHGRVRRASLGIVGAQAPLPPDLARSLGRRTGLQVVDVIPGSAAAEAGLPVHEYGPMQVKQALVGTGRAGKDQVAFMVRALLKLQATPTNSHMADALAIALTHIQSRRILAHK